MFEEIKNIKTSNKDIRSFGITMGIILLLVSTFLFYHDKSSYQTIAITASVFIVLGIIIPISLKPVYLVWMIYHDRIKM
jgi:FtsH-binding integral membrane protein